jgi:hypothetical protein
MDCWLEKRVSPDYEKFESKLDTLIALANLAPEETLRRENRERFRYPNRAGGVTQYPAGQFEDIRTDELFFLTVNLFDGNAYTVFQNTKRAVALNPLGVLADLPKLSESKFANWEIPKRLLSFAMGVSEVANFWGLYDEPSFNNHFTKICEALALEGDCSPHVEMTSEMELITESPEFLRRQCDAYVTEIERVFVAKKPVTPWFDSEGARSRGAFDSERNLHQRDLNYDGVSVNAA